MKSLKDVQAFAGTVVKKEEDLGNVAVAQGVTDIVEMRWQMENKAWWVKEQISSDGYDTVKDAVDLMGTRNPKLSVTP